MEGTKVLLSLLTSYFVNEVCYKPYGCFNKDFPFNSLFYSLPNSPDKITTTFWLHARNITSPVQVHPLESGHKNHFMKRKKLVVLGHGFLQSSNEWWLKKMVTTLLEHEDMNVVTVDWKKGAALPYNAAVGNSRLVGRQISYMLQQLLNATSLRSTDIHLVGFSLGAHLMGFAGQNLREKGFSIGRISGLDPAGPNFEDVHIDARLDPTDAEFVDVIHTDTKTVLITGLGIESPIGHADFYPNGGSFQPGCKKVTIDIFSKKDVFKYVGCNHYRAVDYFIESIHHKKAFEAFKCSNYRSFKTGKCKKSSQNACNNMGFHARKKNGQFYLMTNDKAPFSGYHYLVKVVTGTKDFSNTFAKLRIKLYGDKGVSGEEVTKSRFFSTGSTHSLVLHTDKKIGELMKVKFTHEPGYWLDDAWFLTKVMVIPMWNMNKYVGCENMWISGQTKSIEITKESQDKTCEK